MVPAKAGREIPNSMMAKVLRRHGFWNTRIPWKYAIHNERYGTIEVILERDKERPWITIAKVHIKESNREFEFNSAKKLNEFLSRIEQNTRLYGFSALPGDYLAKELERILKNV